MAERRMFAKTIIDSDAFLDMPLSTQALYFHLNMRADDDGFINNPRKIQRMIGSSDDDLRLLFAKNFVLPFESGVVVIKHWRIHNYIRQDRKHDTAYLEEKSQLTVKENGAYTLCQSNVSQLVDTRLTEDRLGEDRLGKDRLEDSASDKPKHTRFQKPTLDEIKSYIREKGYTVDAERFYNYYESNGWMVGKNHMKNYRAALATWQSKEPKQKPGRAKGEINVDDLPF